MCRGVRDDGAVVEALQRQGAVAYLGAVMGAISRASRVHRRKR